MFSSQQALALHH